MRVMLCVLAMIGMPVLALAVDTSGAPAAPVAEGEEYVDPGEAEFDEIEVLRKKAASEGAWQQNKDEQIAIDQQVLREPWPKVPFDQRPFDYTPEQIRDNWDALIGNNFQLSYPSASFLREAYRRFPAFGNAHPDFDGDFDKLERDLGNVWRLFLRGDYQAAMQQGQALGPMGKIAGKVGQLFSAVYLQPDLAKKHMMLQDAANVIREQGEGLEQLKKSKEQIYKNTYVVGRIAYTYAIGRIAEDVPIPVAISRNYVFKVLGAIDDVRTLAPDNPLGYAASAAADANVVRKVGKATGRITFGAKQASIRTDFERALQSSNIAMIRYEYANAMLYVNKRRDIDEALDQLRRAEKTRPRFAMEALDAMYASKRRREVEALAKSTASFRSFERKRLKYQKENNINLYCVLPQTCKPFLIP